MPKAHQRPAIPDPRSAGYAGPHAQAARPASAAAPSDRYRPETGCAASAEGRGDSLVASAPPAERWLLIEHNGAWPRAALTALRRTPPRSGKSTRPTDPAAPDARPTDDLASEVARPADDLASEVARPADDLASEVARLCTAARCRPVLIRRHGRAAGTEPRRWMLVDSRPGHESIRRGHLPTDEHLLDVLSGADPGTSTTDPVYLVCTHGRHDACCAVRGRPAAAALAAAYPDRTWECSHIGGDRFAANLVFLPHSLFYGHVPPTEAVALAQAYDEGLIVPAYYRGSGTHLPAVQAAQHFARTAGHSLSVNALHPLTITQPIPNHWRVALHPTAAEDPSSADNAEDTAHSAHPATAGSTGALAGDGARAADTTHLSIPTSSETADAAGTPRTPGIDAIQPGDTSPAHKPPTGASFESPDGADQIVVEVRARLVAVDGQMTCAARPPGQVRQFSLEAPVRVEPRESAESVEP